MLIQRLKPHHCFSAWCAGWLFLSACAIPTLGQELPLPKDTLPETLELIRVPLGLEQVQSDVVSEEWVALGRRLFFDPILSADQTVSCATCHQPDHGFASPEAVSVGIGGMKGTRNAPSILNTVYRKSLFWDGRTATLEEQALEPIENAVEMGHDLSNIIGRLQEDPGYSEQFIRVFGQPVSEEGLSKALASFQRVLLSGDHGVDRFRAGEFKALTTEERNGMWIFESKGQCWRCHSGANLTDEDFHNTGVSWGKEPLDLGRFDVTGNKYHRGQFKTPSLRSVALTPPYMHDGSIKTLREVVDFYNEGGGTNPSLDNNINPLNLTERELEFLTAFLESLRPSSGTRRFEGAKKREDESDPAYK
ncbi:MAG: cytochrome c peroxidase [Planctomycetota bacterium]|nr:cytochrome c peroxidase [Planctomycetota bacterium]